MPANKPKVPNKALASIVSDAHTSLSSQRAIKENSAKPIDATSGIDIKASLAVACLSFLVRLLNLFILPIYELCMLLGSQLLRYPSYLYLNSHTGVKGH